MSRRASENARVPLGGRVPLRGAALRARPVIHYLDKGEGQTLLLVHGGFSDGPMTWASQMRSLPAHHRLLVVDRRGHGASPVEPRPYTIGGDAEDVTDVADHAGEERYHLVAHSYGGLVALEAAVRAPERVLSLHLIEPPYLALLPDDPDVVALDRGVRRILEEGPGRSPDWAAAEFFQLIMGPEAAERLRSRPEWPGIVRESRRILDEEYAGEYPAGVLERVRLSVPVRVYTGGRSHPALRKLARRLSERIEGAELIEIPDATHAVQAAGEPFNRALLAITGRARKR